MTATFTAAELDRYARQIILAPFGGAGQAALAAAHIVVVGAGGIGCPAVQALAAAGAGRLTIIDDDVVEVSNLPRQTLFHARDIGAAKAEVAAAAARALNPHIRVDAAMVRITPANAAAQIAGADLVLDGCDNFAARLAVNAACVAGGIPLLSAAIGGFASQIGLFCGHQPDQPCYQCLVGGAPDAAAANCSDTGVLGPVAAQVGAQAAAEAVRHLAGYGPPLAGRVLIGDHLTRRWREARIHKDPECAACHR